MIRGSLFSSPPQTIFAETKNQKTKKPKTQKPKNPPKNNNNHISFFFSFTYFIGFFPFILFVADEHLGFINRPCSLTLPPHRNLYLFSAVRLYSVAVRLCDFSGSLLASGKRYTPHARKRPKGNTCVTYLSTWMSRASHPTSSSRTLTPNAM